MFLGTCHLSACPHAANRYSLGTPHEELFPLDFHALPSRANVNATLKRSCNPRDKIGQVNRGVGTLASFKRGRNCDRLAVILKPREECRFLVARKTLLIEPGIIRAHIRIDQRALRVELRLALMLGQQFVHLILALARGETSDNRQRLGAAERLPRGPLHECRREDLRSRTFRQQTELEPVEHAVSTGIKPGFFRLDLRQHRAKSLGIEDRRLVGFLHAALKRGAWPGERVV